MDVTDLYLYLIKTDPNGNTEWEQPCGIGTYNSGYSVQQTTDGGYITVGYTDPSPVVGNSTDIYLVKVREPIPGDFDIDWDVDFIDYVDFTLHWMDNSCTEPNWCEGADFNENGSVDFADLGTFVEHWLEH